MSDSEIIKRINECLTLVHRHLDTADRDARHNAPDAAISEKFGIREWWLHEYRQTSGNRV